MPGQDAAVIALQGQVEVGIIVFDGADERAHVDGRGQFFLDFAAQGLLRGFAGLDFAAGEFPISFEFAVAALGGVKAGL